MDGLQPVTRCVPASAVPPSELRPPDGAPARDYPELLAVDREHYVIEREIAKGGMGRVLAAWDRRLGRAVAIKELLPKNRHAARRFEREARITAHLQHPSIIHIYEAGTWPGGEPFFAMTQVAGRSLDKVVAERPTLEARAELLRHVTAAADALAYAHSKHVIHRDLKPANVLVGEFGETVVIDWGLAKDLGVPSDPKETVTMPILSADPGETASGSVVGTPAYMPPEQARGEAVDQRADVYALGALLYHVLVGAAPYAAKRSRDVLELVRTTAPVPVREREPGAPADLVAIVEKAMARAPADRYATAGELASDLKRFETGQLVAARRYTPTQLARRWLRRYRVVVGVASVALVALSVTSILSVERIVTERDRAELAQQRAEHATRLSEGRRIALLEERARTELLAGRAGPALGYLAGALVDGVTGGARGFLLAEAMRPFAAEIARLPTSTRSVAVATTDDGALIATAGTDEVRTWTADGFPRARFGGVGATRVLAFAPDGAWLAGGGADGQTHIWPSGGGAAIVLGEHVAAITDLAWSPDGTRLVTASADRTARVWDRATGVRIALSTCHTGIVTSARFSPDGARVVTASEDHIACVWSATSGIPIGLLRGHGKTVNSARWTPDGLHVVTASDDGTARVWDPERGTPVLAAYDVGGAVELALPLATPRGDRLLTTGTDHVARIWDLPRDSTPADRGSLVTQLVGHADAIVDAVISPDGARIATAGRDHVARVWAMNGQLVGSFEHADAVLGVAFAAGGKHLVTASRDGSTRIWDLALIGARVTHGAGSTVNAVAVAPDGTLTAGMTSSRVTLWHGDTARVLAAHLGSVYAVAFAPDGKTLVSAGEDPEAIVWDPATGAQLASFGGHTLPVHALAFSSDGKTVVTAADDGVELWSMATHTRVRTLPSGGGSVTSLAVRDDLIVGTRADGVLLAWNTHTEAPPAQLADAGAVMAVAFAPDGTWLVAAGDGFANIYDVTGGQLAAHPSRALEGPLGTVVATTVSHDGALVFTASTDGGARAWDAAKGKLLGTRTVHGAARALALAPDDTLWLASEDGSVTGWDVHEATTSARELARFASDKHVPWRLGDDDVVRPLKRQGGSDGATGSHE